MSDRRIAKDCETCKLLNCLSCPEFIEDEAPEEDKSAQSLDETVSKKNK